MKKAVLLISLLLLLVNNGLKAQTETEESLYMKGINAYIQREFKAAAYYWRRVLEINPQNEKAQSYMEKAYDKYNAMQLHFYNGVGFFNENNFTNAIAEFQETLMINPNHEKAIYYLNLCYQTLSLFDKNKNKDEMEAQVVKLMQENEFRKAVAMYKVLVMLDPDNERLKLALADAESKLKQTDLKDELFIHLEAARQFSKQEKYPAAIAEWEKALLIDPDNAEAKAGLERDKKALIEKERNERINAFMSQGVDDYMNRKYKEARVSFQKVLQIDPKNATARDYITKIDSILKAMAEEQTAFDESNKHLNQGIQSYNNEQYYKALDSFQTALSIYDRNEKAKEYLELTKQKISEYELKQKKEREERIQALLEKAVELYSLNEYAKSRTLFQQVLQLDPENEMAKNYIRLINEIIEIELKSQVTIDSPYYPVYTRLMESAEREFAKANMDASLSFLQEILNLFPLNKAAQKLRLKILYKTNPEQFKEILGEYIRRGNDYLSREQYRLAKNEFLTVKEIAPDYPGIDGLIASCVPRPRADIAEIEKAYNTGMLLFQQSQFAEAEAQWKRVIELDNSPDSNPYYARAYLNIAKAKQRQQGGAPAATQAPAGAVTDKEKQIQKFYYMGVAYYTQGDYQKAIAEWQKVLALDKNNVLAINNIQKARKKMEYMK